MRNVYVVLVLTVALGSFAGLARATGNVCTFTNRSGSACSSKTCSASAVAADSTHNNFTSSGTCPQTNGYTPWTNADNIVIPNGYTFTDDVGGAYGNYNGPVLSYISSLYVYPGSTASCTTGATAIQGKNIAGTNVTWAPWIGNNSVPQISVALSSGAVTSATMVSGSSGMERGWYDTASVIPAAKITDANCTYVGTCGANACAAQTAIVPVWAQGGGTPAIQVNGGGTFITASAVTVRGDLELVPSASGQSFHITHNAGSSLTFDSSGAAAYSDGTTPIYGAFIYNFSGYNSLSVVYAANGTSGSHVTITSNTGGTYSNWLNQRGDPGALYSVTMSYADLSHLGGILDPILDGNTQWTTQVISTWNVTHSTFNDVGSIMVGRTSGTQTINHQYNVHTNQRGVSDFVPYGNYSIGSSTRNISYNVFGSQFGCVISGSSNGSSNLYGTTFTGNYLADTGCTQMGLDTSGAFGGIMNYNLFRWYKSPVGNQYYGAVSETGNYYMRDSPAFNPQFVSLGTGNTPAVNLSLTGNIIDISEDLVGATNSEMYVPPNGDPASGTWARTVANNIALKSKQGHGNDWGLTDYGTANHQVYYINHNVMWGTNLSAGGGSACMGFMAWDHPTAATFLLGSGTLKSNLYLGLGGGNYGCKANTNEGSGTGHPTADVITPTNTDYNAGQNLTLTNICTTQSNCTGFGNGYMGMFTTAPGPHDIDVVLGLGAAGINPQLAASNRNLARWDTGYLGNTATAWSNSGSYSGCPATCPTVSDSRAGIYSGATINYRAVANHTSTAVTEPDITLSSGNGLSSVTVSGGVATITTSANHGLSSGETVFFWDAPGDEVPCRVATVTGPTTFTVPTTLSDGIYTSTAYVQIWRNFWEYASEYDLRTAIPAGTTYTDGSINCTACLPVQALVNWIMTGYVPMNPALWLAGHDGLDVGAASLAPAQHIRFVRRVP